MSLTVRQHYVPRVYLRAWACPNGMVNVTDKKTGKSFTPAVENICLEKNFYEDPKLPPTNEIENMFTEYEGSFGKARNFLSFISENAINDGKSVSTEISSALNALPHHLKAIKQFAGISYFRTPKAFKEIKEQLKSDKNPKANEALSLLESPYVLNLKAFESTILERFLNLHIAVLYSKEKFIASDSPCVPLAGGKEHSNFAYDIGRHEAAFAVMPITPNIAALFLPNLSSREPIIIPKDTPKEFATQLNDILVEYSDRWIIKPFINQA